jgi:hypothetical protein
VYLHIKGLELKNVMAKHLILFVRGVNPQQELCDIIPESLLDKPYTLSVKDFCKGDYADFSIDKIILQLKEVNDG